MTVTQQPIPEPGQGEVLVRLKLRPVNPAGVAAPAARSPERMCPDLAASDASEAGHAHVLAACLPLHGSVQRKVCLPLTESDALPACLPTDLFSVQGVYPGGRARRLYDLV